MKRILLASVAALGLAGTASAADLAVRAAPVPVPLFTWTGCYLGVNGGWIGSNSDYTTGRTTFFPNADPIAPANNNLLTQSYSASNSAGTVGGQFGCQYQWGWLVLGGEWDANWAGVKDDNTFAYNRINFVTTPLGSSWNPRQELTHTQLDWFTTARVRVGAAWWDRVLIYATGGLAMAPVDSYTQVAFNPGNNPFFIPQYFGAYRESRIGWTVGGGIEWAFAQNWTAKAEFLYIDLGSDDYVSPRTSFNGTTDTRVWASSVDTQAYVARVGINYLFHLGPAVAPVVARY